MIHPKDKRTSNPRIQCVVCAKWMRLNGRDEQGNFIQRFFGGCSFAKDHGTHLAGKYEKNGDLIDDDVCEECCQKECKRMTEIK